MRASPHIWLTEKHLLFMAKVSGIGEIPVLSSFVTGSTSTIK